MDDRHSLNGSTPPSPAAAPASSQSGANPSIPLRSSQGAEVGTGAGESTCAGVCLRLTATFGTETVEGGYSGGWLYRDHEVDVVRFEGPGVDATAYFNRDGEARIEGRCPRYTEDALAGIAELLNRVEYSTSWEAEGYPDGCWWWLIDADGNYEGVEQREAA